jgi:hypothetical protein
MRRLQHPGDKHLLAGWYALSLYVGQLEWVWVLPLDKMARAACDAGVTRSMITGGYYELVIEKQFGTPSAAFAPRLS